MVIKLLRRATGSWTLERKSILFFGTTLLVSVTISSWVMHRVTQDLVKNNTRQIAHDYAMLQVYNVHMIDFDGSEPQQTLHGETFNAFVRKKLYESLIYNPRFKARVLSLDLSSNHWHLPDRLSEPVTGSERELLIRLEREFRSATDNLSPSASTFPGLDNQAQVNSPTSGAATELQTPSLPTVPTTSSSPASPNGNPNLATARAEPSANITPAPITPGPIATSQDTLSPNAAGQSAIGQGTIGQGTIGQSGSGASVEPALAQSADNPASSIPTDLKLTATRDDVGIFREVGPVDGWYTYYHPIHFHESCLTCHRAKVGASHASPFRVMRIMLPEEESTVWSVRFLAVMISVAMVTLAVTLMSMHMIMRKLVVRPLRHLRSVSEEIIRGKLDRRAEIDTDDEFRELADAFNRMLRHLTESQQQLQSLNQTLDLKVDQLAQANLHLYEANRLKSDFLANMSHELRTPLNSIIGFSDVLQDISSLTDKQRRYAANIQKSGRMLLEMINDILDLAKIEAGKLQVKPLLFDINQVLQAQCDMTRSLSEQKNIDVQLVPDNSLQLVFQDAPKIQQIVNNLLSNAIKFTPEGGLVTISTGTKGTDYFQITVADTGVGIPETDFEIIFEKFRQSNAMLQGDNLTRQYSGTGLGLSIVKELCKLLGGEISLSSHVGKGSTFCVTLPRHYHNHALGETANPEAPGLIDSLPT